MFWSEAFRFYGICRQNREPTSGLEPLTCSLRVITQALQGCAGDCKSRIFRGVSFLRLAECCTVLRSRWYQSGINGGIAASRSCSIVALTCRTSSISPDRLESCLSSAATLAGCLRVGCATADSMDRALG